MKYLYVGGMADADGDALRAIRQRLASEVGAPAREILLPSADFAFDAGRRQYGSIPVLETLVRLCPEDALKLVALTECDLFLPVLTFVYGQAQLGGRVAVVSLARLHQEFYGLAANQEVFLERAVKEALHETGHLFGLRHCENAGCAMALATNIRQIDLKRAEFCALCAARFRRR